MNKVVAIILALVLVGCVIKSEKEMQPVYIDGNSKKYSDELEDNSREIRYFKDTRTNLCFAERGFGDGYTFTCVPCDSVKNFLQEISK